MDYMLKKKDGVIRNIRFDNAPGSLLSDLFTAITPARQ